MKNKKEINTILIRNYREEDREDCRSLWVELTEWHREIYDSPGIGGNDPGSFFDKHLERVGKQRIWVAELDGRIAGMTGMIPGEEEPELEPLVVSEKFRGMGIGRKLAETVIQAAQDEGSNSLKVRPVARNKQAIQVFHELGFRILGHLDMFMDFSNRKPRPWKQGYTIAGKRFKI